MDASAQRKKLGQLTSSIGAGILGIGIGGMAARTLVGLELVIIAVGLVLHLWGMVDTHRAEAGAAQPAWAKAMYWLCWIGLAGLVVFVIARAL